MVWHDPTVIQREVWVGTAVVVASIAFLAFTAYAAFMCGPRLRRYRFIVVTGLWLALFTAQLAYVATSSTVIYGVYYDEATGEYVYYSAANPMAYPVVAITVLTAVVTLALLLFIVVADWGRRIRAVTGWYVE